MGSEQTLFGQERWTAVELAAALLLSVQRVNQLVKEGVLPASVDGRYTPIDAVPCFVRHLKKREAGKSMAGEQLRKSQIENELRHIKLQKIAGQLVSIDQVARDWFSAGRMVRDALLNLPARLSGVFAAESDQQNIFVMFTKEVNQVLTVMSSKQISEPVTARLPMDEPPESAGSLDDDPEEGAHEEIDRESQVQDDRFSTGD